MLCLPLVAQESKDDEDPEEEVFNLSPFTVEASPDVGYRISDTLAGARIRTNLADVGSAMSVVTADFLSDLGATVGGAQDINLFRTLVDQGLIPPSSCFTPEGLFSQHDLPLGGEAQDGYLIDVTAQAIRFDSQAQPGVEALVQLGFTSGIDAATFKPKPLNLVAVVDKSGYMSGQPLELARKSLRQLASQLGRDDQLSIVLYGNSTYIHLQPTRVTETNRLKIDEAIAAISSSGSTYMEAGLRLGYTLAELSAESFRGSTRVMLFTDEQPNVGRSDAESFIAMATEASLKGIGLTTIGVGTHFGAELAEKISSVRGGNLFFFEDATSMEETFRKELDTMILELAHDMRLVIAPSRGNRIAGLYGIPGDMVTWNQDGSLSLEIATIFASRNKGAIFFGVGSEDKRRPLRDAKPGQAVASVSLSYIQADNDEPRETRFNVTMTHPSDLQSGILAGSYLVDQFATMQLATKLVENGAYQDAYQVLEHFTDRELPEVDSDLANEEMLVNDLADLVWDECERRGLDPEETSIQGDERRNGILGEWIQVTPGSTVARREILRFNQRSEVEIYTSSDEDPLRFVSETHYETDGKKLVFGNKRQTLSYHITDDQLVLMEGKRATQYTRRATPQAESRDELLARLRREVCGLPEVKSATLAAVEE